MIGGVVTGTVVNSNVQITKTSEINNIQPVVINDNRLDTSSNTDINREISGTTLTAKGEVLNTVEDVSNQANEKLGVGSTVTARGSVLDAVAQANNVKNLGDQVGERPAGDINPLNVEGVKGFSISFVVNEVTSGVNTENLSNFPLRIDLSDIDDAAQDESNGLDRLIIRSILRDQALYLDINYSILSNSTLKAVFYSVKLANGDPLPSWIQVYDNGALLTGRPPADLRTVDLRVEVTLSDATDIVRYIQVDVTSGEITTLESMDSEALKSTGVPIFSQRMGELSHEFSGSVEKLIAAVKG